MCNYIHSECVPTYTVNVYLHKSECVATYTFTHSGFRIESVRLNLQIKMPTPEARNKDGDTNYKDGDADDRSHESPQVHSHPRRKPSQLRAIQVMRGR